VVHGKRGSHSWQPTVCQVRSAAPVYTHAPPPQLTVLLLLLPLLLLLLCLCAAWCAVLHPLDLQQPPAPDHAGLQLLMGYASTVTGEAHLNKHVHQTTGTIAHIGMAGSHSCTVNESSLFTS
jgi:hypothetical protein